MKKLSLKISQYSQENTCVGVSFNKLAGPQADNFIKKRLQYRCFPLNITKFFRTLILKSICERLFLTLQLSIHAPRKGWVSFAKDYTKNTDINTVCSPFKVNSLFYPKDRLPNGLRCFLPENLHVLEVTSTELVKKALLIKKSESLLCN